MLFFLALINFAHGLFGLLVTKLRSVPIVWDGVVLALPDPILKAVMTAWPEDVFQPWEKNNPDLVPTPQRGYAISAAQILLSGWYLFTNHRPSAR